MGKYNTKIIIIEGPDNCGKDSLISKLSEYYNSEVKVIHAIAPGKVNLFDFYYNGFVHDTLEEYYSGNVKALIHNRSMYGEYVYGPRYRGKNKSDVARMLYKLEAGQLKTFLRDDELYFIVLNSSDAKLLANNDDGKSISNKEEDILAEIESFNEIYTLSEIHNKKQILVNNGSSFRSKEDIFSEVINLIEGAK